MRCVGLLTPSHPLLKIWVYFWLQLAFHICRFKQLWKQYFQSTRGYEQVGMLKILFWSLAGWLCRYKTHGHKGPTVFIEKYLHISGPTQFNLCCSRVNCMSIDGLHWARYYLCVFRAAGTWAVEISEKWLRKSLLHSSHLTDLNCPTAAPPMFMSTFFSIIWRNGSVLSSVCTHGAMSLVLPEKHLLINY